MNRPAHAPASRSKVPAESPAVRPRAKRGAETIDQTQADAGDPFALFTEWSGEADEKAYAKL